MSQACLPVTTIWAPVEYGQQSPYLTQLHVLFGAGGGGGPKGGGGEAASSDRPARGSGLHAASKMNCSRKGPWAESQRGQHPLWCSALRSPRSSAKPGQAGDRLGELLETSCIGKGIIRIGACLRMASGWVLQQHGADGQQQAEAARHVHDFDTVLGMLSYLRWPNISVGSSYMPQLSATTCLRYIGCC